MRIAFRVDSSPNIGMGHLMRCLTLANGISRHGFECYFIARDFIGNGAKRVEESKFGLELLSIEGLQLDDTWLGVPYDKDVADTIRVIDQRPIDWLIVDHYNIDHQWEEAIRARFPDLKIMVIDDLVDRKHDCDFLLDQTFGRTYEEYEKLIPKNARVCLGTEHALLRPEFRTLRDQKESLKRKDCHILVTLGGGDNFHPIQVIGEALKSLGARHEFSATVITGDTPEVLLSDYKSLDQDVTLISFSSQMPVEMAKADFVIGAGGGTSWERCCMGLPTVVLTIADNQIEIARILHDKKAGISVKTNVDEIALAVEKMLTDVELRNEMSANAAMLCDGEGVDRVVQEIIVSSLEFKNASLCDAEFIYEARYAGDGSKYYRNSDVPSFESHASWLEQALDNEDMTLVCISLFGRDIAHVRMDKSASKTGEIGICLAQEWRGRGLGQAILHASNLYFSEVGFSKIHAEVHKDNIASASVFNRAGYIYLSTDSDGFMRYLWQV